MISTHELTVRESGVGSLAIGAQRLKEKQSKWRTTISSLGAGSSGAVLAVRLSENPSRSVLLLEAGPDYATSDQLPEDLVDSYRLSVG